MSDNGNPERSANLRDPDEAARHINSACQDDDIDTLLGALQQVVREHGVSRIAESSGLSRESLYRSLSKDGNPGIRSLHRILAAIGLRLYVFPNEIPPIFTKEEYHIVNDPGLSGHPPDIGALVPIFEKQIGDLMQRTQEEIVGLVRSVEANIMSTINETRAQPVASHERSHEEDAVLRRAATLSLTALTDPDDIAAAFRVMTMALQRNGQPFDTFIGWPGGGRDLRVYWHQNVGLWSLSEAFGESHPGYWFGFGVLNPAGRTQMAPDMQLGMIGSGSSRRFAGVFARDSEGRVYATHNGRFQVRYQRTRPEAFLQTHPHQNVATVFWPDGIERTNLVVAAIDAPQLVSEVASFVQTVEAYKENLRGV